MVGSSGGSTRLSGSSARYKLLIQLLSRHPRYAKAIADTTKPSEMDALAHALVAVTHGVGGTLPIIRDIMSLEFAKKCSSPETILRVNSIASKICGIYVRKLGLSYLKRVIGDLISELVNAPDLDLEVDSSKLSERSDPEGVAKTNLEELCRWCNSFLDRITSSESIEEMPREIRAVAFYILDFSRRFGLPERGFSAVPLVGGFLMLRFFCPAITLPSSFGVLSEDELLPVPVRRNLTMIAKILQKTSNGEFFAEDSDQYLSPINEFIRAESPRLNDFLLRACEDPLGEGLSEPFADVDPPVSFEALHFKEFDVKDLFFIHGLLHRNAQDIIFRVQEYSLDENSVLNQLHDSSDLSGTLRSPVPEESPDLLNRTTDYRGRLSSPSVLYSSDGASKLRPISGVFDQPFLSSDAEFVKLIGELGPPPPTGKRALSIRLTKNRRGETPDHRTSSSESGQLEEASQSDAELLRTQELIDIGLKNLLIKSTRFDTSALEQSGFFYRHGNDTAGDPVFYVILHRMSIEILSSMDSVALHVIKVLEDRIHSGQFTLVVDLSWFHVTDAAQVGIHRQLMNLSTLFSSKHLTNIKCLYLLHPSIRSSEMMTDLLQALPLEFREQCVRLVHDWNHLIHSIPEIENAVPLQTRMWIPQWFTARMIHHFGSNSEAIPCHLKCSSLSLLIFDVKRNIKEEIFLDDVAGIQFDTDSVSFFLSIRRDSDSREDIRFDLDTISSRNYLLDLLYESSVLAGTLSFPQAFEIVKVNKRSWRQKRVFIFSRDSLLNMGAKSIHKEIPFSSIYEVAIDEHDAHMLYISFHLGGDLNRWKIVSSTRDLLYHSLLDAIARFKQGVGLDLRRSEDIVLASTIEKFLSHLGGRKDFEENHIDSVPSAGSSSSAAVYGRRYIRIPTRAGALRAAFGSFDTAGTGRVLMSDFEELLHSAGLQLQKHEVDLLVSRLDPDGIGSFTVDELVHVWLNATPSLHGPNRFSRLRSLSGIRFSELVGPSGSPRISSSSRSQDAAPLLDISSPGTSFFDSPFSTSVLPTPLHSSVSSSPSAVPVTPASIDPRIDRDSGYEDDDDVVDITAELLRLSSFAHGSNQPTPRPVIVRSPPPHGSSPAHASPLISNSSSPLSCRSPSISLISHNSADKDRSVYSSRSAAFLVDMDPNFRSFS